MEMLYWDGNGKYQKDCEMLSDLMPTFGMTDNPYLNIFITASKLYHDVYNNGGGNIEHCFINEIKANLLPYQSLFRMKFSGEAKDIAKRFKNKKTLENFINRVIEIVKDKDLTHTTFKVYANFDKDLLSMDLIDGWRAISFTDEKGRDGWIKAKMDTWNYKLITVSEYERGMKDEM